MVETNEIKLVFRSLVWFCSTMASNEVCLKKISVFKRSFDV